jgi:UDP-hydrolysing UDP-N-acetyl-D-glucosamine 2-epimerase
MPHKIDPPLLEVVVTARPSWARVKSLVINYAELTSPSKVRVTLLGPAVSKRYGNLSNQVPGWLRFEQIPALLDSDSLAAVAMSCTSGANVLINKWAGSRPDCVLVVADRTETLGVSLSAALMQIPLIHLQGGEISGSIDDKIRDTNSKLADLHLTTNLETARRLHEMGEDPSRVFAIGCPSIDIVNSRIVEGSLIYESNSEKLGGVGSVFSLNEPYGIIMFHPDTLNESENLEWVRILIALTKEISINWLWFWPNPDHGSELVSHEIRSARESGNLGNVRFVINLAPETFVDLALAANVMVGNSSFGIREASFIGLPVINVGKRQAGRQKALNVIDFPELETIDSLTVKTNEHISKSRFASSNLYGDGSAGNSAAQIISQWEPNLKVRPSLA